MFHIFVWMSHYAKTNGLASSFDPQLLKVNSDLNTCWGNIQAEYTTMLLVYESGPILQLLLVKLQPFSRTPHF